MSTYLDVESLKGYLRIAPTDTLDDELLSDIVEAVEAEQRARLIADTFPHVDPQGNEVGIPGDAYLAALMRGARLYARRASPEGLVGLGESGIARIPAYDRDIDALEAPWRSMVMA